MTPSSLRVDPIRGWQTIVAPARGGRPFDVRPPSDADPARPAGRSTDGAPECPFCPGMESELGEIVAELPPVHAGEPWGARAVRNRYPFLKPPARPEASEATAGGVQGVQEVLIDGPAHEMDPAAQSSERRRAVLRMWRDRVEAARAAGASEVHLFRNHGRDAGSSRRHPHAQLVATTGVTPERRHMLERLDAAGIAGRCLLCGDREADAAERRVLESGAWRVATLHAPLDPCHLRIVPRRHVHSLTALDDPELDELADLLGRIHRAVEDVLGEVARTLLVHDLGGRGPGRHLHLELRPRVTRLAGFEQSSGVGVCPSDPIEDAAALGEAVEARGDASQTSAARFPGHAPGR